MSRAGWLLWAVLAGAPATQTFPLSGHGLLRLGLPASWKATVQEHRADLPPTLRFYPAGRHIKLVVTPIWSVPPKGPVSLEKTRQIIEGVAVKEAPGSVEKKAPLFEVKHGRRVAGYAFTVTDPAPKPGEYLILTEGIVLVGELSLSFSLFYDEPNPPELKIALQALAGGASGRAE